MHTHTYPRTYIHLHMRNHPHTYILTLTHTHTHTYTHTHTHTHTQKTNAASRVAQVSTTCLPGSEAQLLALPAPELRRLNLRGRLLAVV